VGKLPDHLPTCAVLIDERVFPADPGATRDIVHLDQEAGLFRWLLQPGYATIDHALFAMHLCASKSHLVRIGYAGFQRPIEDVEEFRVITKQLQPGLFECALPADTEEIFRRRIDVFDKQAVIEDDDGGVQIFKYIAALWQIAAASDLLSGLSFSA
jgi:hypothetical protein